MYMCVCMYTEKHLNTYNIEFSEGCIVNRAKIITCLIHTK